MSSTRTSALGALLCTFLCGTAADAEIVQYLVTFDESGDVALGSTLNWNLSAVVTDSDGNNFGAETLAIDLQNSTGEVMTPGAIGPAFTDYSFSFGGNASIPGRLTDITASQFFYNASVVELADPSNGGSLGPLLLASGSYQVNTLGMHTLESTLFVGASPSEYFTSAAGAVAAYDSVLFGSDSVNVVAAVVPEPASMLLMSTLLCPAVIAHRRRRRRQQAPAETTA